MNCRHLLPPLSGVLLAIPIASCGRTVSLERQSINRPIQFLPGEAIKGSDGVLEPGATLLLGETHGTWEIPIAVASMVRHALAEGGEAALCIEFPATEQSSIDRFLESDGGNQAIDDLLDTPFWAGQDGRASVGMFAMLELVRRLRSAGKNVHVHTIDVTLLPAEKPAYYRDQTMAENLVRVRKEFPEAILIALTGNVHTKTAKGAPWDHEYIPMGWFVSQTILDLVSLNVRDAGGEAWVMTDRVAGERTMSGKDQGNDPFFLMDDTRESGYDGIFYIGRISAAKPVYIQDGG